MRPNLCVVSAVFAVCIAVFLPQTSAGQLSPSLTSSRSNPQKIKKTKDKKAIQEGKNLWKAAKNNNPIPPIKFFVETAPTADQSLDKIFTKNNICSSCTWTVTPWLVDGMSVDAKGIFTGKPTDVRIFQAHVVRSASQDTSTNGSPTTAEADWAVLFEVLPAKNLPAIVTATLPPVPVGGNYSQTLTAVEGPTEGTFVWAIDPTSLPPGLTADANGYITGSPTTAGIYTINATVTDANGKQATAKITAEIDASPGCGAPKYTNAYFSGVFPLSRKVNTDPTGAGTWQFMTDADVQCFYQSTGPVAAITQVQYIYGFGGGANTLAADMASFQVFAPLGVQVSLGTSVTAGQNTSQTTTTTGSQRITATKARDTTTTTGQSSTAPTVASALQSAEAGGNFYFHILYPVAVTKGQHASLVAVLDPKVGFSFNGFAGQSTLSQGTEQYINIPFEMNGSINGIAKQGGAFFDYRGGLESLPGSFKTASGLSHHNFYLNQLSFGLKFAGVIQIGAQKFWGPSAAYDVSSPSGFNKWHLILQLNPTI